MGACLSAKHDLHAQKQHEQDSMVVYVPHLHLKCQLMDMLNLEDDHFFAPFIEWRFKNNFNKKFNGTAYNVEMQRKR